MEIKNNLKEITIPEIKPKKKDAFIWGLLLGMCLECIILFLIVRPSFSNLVWGVWHRQELEWVIQRYNTIQTSAKMIYMER